MKETCILINKIIQVCKTCGKNHLEWKSVKPDYCCRKCYYKSKIGKPSGSSGIKWTKEQKEKLKKRPKLIGEKNGMWKGGIKKVYSSRFRRKLRQLIKKRDNFTCQNCLKRTVMLVVHHIDENTKNDNLDNLITLCRSCHVRLHNG